jgi:hypothetical protein
MGMINHLQFHLVNVVGFECLIPDGQTDLPLGRLTLLQAIKIIAFKPGSDAVGEAFGLKGIGIVVTGINCRAGTEEGFPELRV